jgi:two-component system chemotaxis sensor kinase CheA
VAERAVTIDLDQFHAAFFEESGEALDSMEAALLRLGVGTPESETINTIFRVAHSIKGGAGMFGFSEIAEFTHVLETLLDELRSSRMQVTEQISDLLLQSVDVLRTMISSVQNSTPYDALHVQRLRGQLSALVGAASGPAGGDSEGGIPEPAPAATATAGPATRADAPCWHVRFKALPLLLVRGNDPLRMISELAALGEMTVKVDLGALPCLNEVDPDNCVLVWDLYLRTTAPIHAIELIFEWAHGDCVLSIDKHEDPPAAAAPVGPEVVAASVEAAPAEEPDGEELQPPSVHSQQVASAPSPGRPAASNDGGSIRVSIEKIDELLNTVGEIVITQSMLTQLAAKLDGLSGELLCNGLAQLETNIRELQEGVMRVRMLPVSFVFSRFPRLVRDLSQRLGKQIKLTMTGEQTELDKTVLEKIGDPLVHLVRNSIDHGIEFPEERLARGKPAEGTVHLHASHKGGAITLEIRDDGKGLDKERLLSKARSRGLVDPSEHLTDAQIHDLIFLPGFSTADKTTELSGRGVGMDVVRRNIKELGGSIDLRSEPGIGTSFTISLPLTLAIMDGQSVAVGNEVYIVPLVAIIESLQLKPGVSNSLVGHSDVFHFRGEYVPIIRLHEVFGVAPRTSQLHDGLIMVVEGEGRRAGLFVDALLGQQQVVIKSMEANYGPVEGVGGATILGEGTVALIIDVPGLIRLAAARVAVRRAG